MCVEYIGELVISFPSSIISACFWGRQREVDGFVQPSSMTNRVDNCVPTRLPSALDGEVSSLCHLVRVLFRHVKRGAPRPLVFRKEGVPLRSLSKNYSDPTWIKTRRYNDPVEIRLSKDTEDWKKSASQGGAGRTRIWGN